jgi:NADH-quinone oxidoreductase subunit A
MANYLPIAIQLVLALGLSVVLVILSRLVGRRRKSQIKGLPYECGMMPRGDAQHRFSVKFYLIAIVFILFDIEAVFLMPWAVVFRDLKMKGFLEMMVYMVIVLAGFWYIWAKGVIDWNSPERAE